MFKVGEAVVLKNSSQNKVMRIQAYNDEFIRAYCSKKEYSFAHESNFRHATEQEIAAGHRIDHFVEANNMVDANAGVTVITPKGTSKVKGGMTAFVDMDDDTHIENHISPLCKQNLFSDANDMVDSERLQQWKNNIPKFAGFRASNLSKNESQDYLAIKTDAQIIAELKAENKILNQAASTHLKNQMHFKKLYDALVEQLYPYAIDLEEPVDGDVNIASQEFINGYNRARECAHYNLLEMMESDEEYIRAQCGMLGGGGEE